MFHLSAAFLEPNRNPAHMSTARQISTDRGAETAKPGKDGSRIDYSVKAEPGLRLRVSERRKVWSFVYTRHSDGKKRQVSFGEYPGMTLKEARRLAGGLRNDVRGGADPASRVEAACSAITFERLAEDWLEKHAKIRRRSWREDERHIRKDVLPASEPRKHTKSEGRMSSSYSISS